MYLGGEGDAEGGGGRPSAAVVVVLGGHRKELLELFTHYSVGTSLTLSGWLAFAEAFDIFPGYLSAEKIEEVFEEAGRSSVTGQSPSAAAAVRGSASVLSFAGFQDCLCLLAKAIAEKQWLVEYSAEKQARYRYKLKDAEKGRVEAGPEERLESLLLGLELNDPSAWRKRAGLSPVPAQQSPASAAAGGGAGSAQQQGLSSGKVRPSAYGRGAARSVQAW